MFVIPDVVRYLFAIIYVFAGLSVVNIIIKSYRFKLDVGLFDMFTASFVGLFCFSAAVLMLVLR